MLLNLDPDDPAHPHTFELVGEMRDRIADSINEGDRIEIDFVAVEYEVVDPDSGPTDSHRAQVLDVRLP